MDIFAFITLFGGLGMFLYGMEIMGDGLKQSSSTALKNILGKLTHNVFFGVLTGTLVTGVIQSSTATIVLTVGLLSAGILNLRQSVSIVMGANIGTTVTAQIIRLMDINSSGNIILEFFKPSTLAPIAIIIGIILIMFVKKRGAKTAGEIFMGFGILFSGLMAMTSSVSPLSASQAFIDILSRFSDIPILGILTGLVLTVIVQSSSAMVGMLQALSSTGVMSFSLVYPVIMGINIGTCVTTAIVCSIGTSKDAKRTGMVHIVFNCIGTVIFASGMAILHNAGAFPGLWDKIVNSGDIANFQTLFNLVTAIILLPFTNQLVKLSMIFIRPDPPKVDKYPELSALDEKLYISPALALAEATKSVAAMSRAASENFALSCVQLMDYDPETTKEINEYEDRIDEFADRADNYLIGLSKHIEGTAASRQLNLLMQTVPNVERIGDYATNFDELGEKLYREKLEFSDSAKRELRILISAVAEIILMTTQALEQDDEDLARHIEPLEEVIDDMVMMLKDRHTERLRKGICSISTGLVFMEALTYLERASDQCSSIAMLMLARHNEAILKNHHAYLRELHESAGEEYMNEFERRKTEYITPLGSIEY